MHKYIYTRCTIPTQAKQAKQAKHAEQIEVFTLEVVSIVSRAELLGGNDCLLLYAHTMIPIHVAVNSVHTIHCV